MELFSYAASQAQSQPNHVMLHKCWQSKATLCLISHCLGAWGECDANHIHFATLCIIKEKRQKSEFTDLVSLGKLDKLKNWKLLSMYPPLYHHVSFYVTWCIKSLNLDFTCSRLGVRFPKAQALVVHLTCLSISHPTTQTHSWMPLKKDPKSPIMPRNSTRLRFFTMNSSQTLEIPYSVAPPRTKRSPNSFCSPGQTRDNKRQRCFHIYLHLELQHVFTHTYSTYARSRYSPRPGCRPTRTSAPTMQPTPSKQSPVPTKWTVLYLTKRKNQDSSRTTGMIKQSNSWEGRPRHRDKNIF